MGVLAYDAGQTFERTVPLPWRTRSVRPLAAFLETDLVIVFDHLTHTLSAIAALHTDAPDFDARYRIAERGVLDGAGADRPTTRRRLLLEPRPPLQTARPDGQPASIAMPTSPRSATAKEAIASGEVVQIVLGRRQTVDAVKSVASTSTARSAASAPARTCSSSECLISRSSAPARNSSSGSRATAC